MPDGVSLATDHYAPKGERLYPTILIRTPYGRRGSAGPSGWLIEFVARRFAERGYNVLVQDVRGCYDSPGKFEPYVHEASDGRATLTWLEQQPWFNGALGMWGQSYLGYTQWALATGAPLYLKALVPSISGSRLPSMAFRDRSIGLDTELRWIFQLDAMDRMRKPGGFIHVHRLRPGAQDRAVQRGASALPLAMADQVTTGGAPSFFQEMLKHPDLQDPFWQALDHGPHKERITASVHLIGGWFDILLRETLEDYQALRAAGQNPYLTVGPWGHLSPQCLVETLREGIVWFDAFLKGDHRWMRKKPVRVYITGRGEWRELDAWPPATHPVHYFLHGGKALSRVEPDKIDSPDSYRYDPAHPTPSKGGAWMTLQAGQRDQRSIERRNDLFVYTSEPLQQDLEIQGAPRLVLYVESSLAHTDFVGRLCDVSPAGRSLNVTEGILRLEHGVGELQADGSLRIEIELWPSSYCFRRAHCLRLQVASGAHPRWNRNLGTGEPVANG
jgi:hypothetical protein